jgi:hypothetical protein
MVVLPRGAEDSGDDVLHAIPIFGFGLQPAFPSRGETVTWLCIIFRFTPFAGNPAPVLHAIESVIERALLEDAALIVKACTMGKESAIRTAIFVRLRTPIR